jgi:hypothetical protein
MLLYIFLVEVSQAALTANESLLDLVKHTQEEVSAK